MTDKMHEEERMRHKLMNDYNAFEWENLDQEADRKWYDFDEDEIANSQSNDFDVFMGDSKKFAELEAKIDELNTRKRG